VGRGDTFLIEAWSIKCAGNLPFFSFLGIQIGRVPMTLKRAEPQSWKRLGSDLLLREMLPDKEA
jgi:hypothetical protein